MTQTPFTLPQNDTHLRGFLRTRRSNLAKIMTGPGPDAETLNDILSIAARVPDHRKLAPWRFIIFEGDARNKIGHHISEVFTAINPELPKERAEFEAARFLRAPVVVGVISSPVECPRGTPDWEQRLSSAVCCYNACLAAQSYGFGAQWLTEWFAYDKDVLAEMGLSGEERVAGFIYIGTANTPSLPRTRPDLSEKVSRYS